MSQDRRQALLRDRGGDLAAIVGREDEGIEVLTQALELDPDDFRSRLWLSFVLLRLGEYERAWPHYREVMIEVGRDALGWRGESLRGCSVAMRLDPDHPPLGDWIFGARYIRPLMERAAKVVVESRPSCVRWRIIGVMSRSCMRATRCRTLITRSRRCLCCRNSSQRWNRSPHAHTLRRQPTALSIGGSAYCGMASDWWQLDGSVAGTRMRTSCARCLLPT
jgi:hypothetical protein